MQAPLLRLARVEPVFRDVVDDAVEVHDAAVYVGDFKET